jgi:hypothetical protein
MLKYGFQLAVVELCTIAAIYSIRLIIDYLYTQKAPCAHYGLWLFIGFSLFRLVSILVRNYYDLHVYNFFRFVETAIQAWIFEEVSRLELWKKIGVQDQENAQRLKSDPEKNEKIIRDSEAQLINILTKDIGVFTSGSW